MTGRQLGLNLIIAVATWVVLAAGATGIWLAVRP